MTDGTAAGGETRTCPKCGETKPTSAFSRSSKTKHGLQSRCKECRKAMARAAYAANPAPHRAYSRESMRRARAKPESWVDVACIDCGKVWAKWKPSIAAWQGRCGSCATTRALANPELRELLAEKARKQVAAWGGRIPNAKPFGVARPISGEAHPRWKGGITDANKRERATAEYVAWRTSVFQRDAYTCQQCGRVGGKLNAHHIASWADHHELRLKIENGVTLCRECHLSLHAEEAGRRLGEARDRARERRRRRAA